MKTLISYNKLKNTGVFFDRSKKKFIKFDLDYKRQSKLNNEFVGYKWYLNRLKKKKQKLFNIKKNLNFLEIDLIKGKKFKSWNNLKGVKKNKENLIIKVIRHYQLIWPYYPSKVCYHGDLTLDNIIFLNSKKIYFIDWENFQKKQEWGLDICYFLISLIALPALTKNDYLIYERNIKLIRNLWKKFFLNKKLIYLKDPINYIKKITQDKNNFFFKIDSKLKNKIYETVLT